MINCSLHFDQLWIFVIVSMAGVRAVTDKGQELHFSVGLSVDI